MRTIVERCWWGLQVAVVGLIVGTGGLLSAPRYESQAIAQETPAKPSDPKPSEPPSTPPVANTTPPANPPANPPPAVPPAAPPPAVAPPPAETPSPLDPPAPPENIIREQTIYVPYTKLRETFEKDGRGVFLPYEQFQELWKAAQAGRLATPEDKPPTGALVSEIDSSATVERDVVRVVAKLKVELLTEGWHRVPLRLGDAAIQSAKLGDQPAHVVFEKDGYYLLVRHPGGKSPAPATTPPAPAPQGAPNPAAPGAPTPPATIAATATAAPALVAVAPLRLDVTLEYAKAFVKNPGQNSVSIEAPQAPINRWQIRVPQAGAKVTVHPLIAATEGAAKGPDAPAAKPDGAAPAPAESSILAFVGSAPNVRIEWTVKAEGASGLAALVNVQARQDVRLEEGVIRSTARLTYDISRAELSQLQMEVPADQKVVNVYDANVRGWDVKTEGDSQKITVQLFQPVRGGQQVVVELEKFLGEMNQKNLALPVVKALGVGRQQGIYLVFLAPELRGEVVRRTGLTQLDANEPLLKSEQLNPAFPFRYATLPIDLAIAMERVQPRIVVQELVEVELEPDHLRLDWRGVYEIERAGVFQLELDLPEGLDVLHVTGVKEADANPVAVESHQLTGEKKNRLVVNLSQKAIGKLALMVAVRKRLSDPNLLSPTGQSSTYALTLPRVAPQGIERSEGRVIVHAPEGLRVNPTDLVGLRPLSTKEALGNMGSLVSQRSASASRPMFAFAYGPPPVALTLGAERRKPAITARQLLAVRVDSGVVKFDATLIYDIRFSGVKQLRLDVPQEIAARLHNETPQIREKPIEQPDPPPAEGYVAWSLSGETELIGAKTIRFTWEQPLEDLAVGKSREVTIPRLAPQGAELERSHGQLVLAKTESLDIHPAGEPSGLRPIDPQHDLMPEAAGKDWARAFEFQADWSLTLAIQRYQLEEVKRTSVELGVVRMVVTRGGETAVQALYRLRSARQRLAFKLPAGYKLDTQPLRINGQFQPLERGDQDELFAPLVNRSSGEALLVELRYTVPGGEQMLELPEFLDDPAVQQIYVCAYLPTEWAMLGWRGQWTEEFSWYWDTPVRMVPLSRQSDAQLIARVIEGVAQSDSPATTFPVDGTMYAFSTLRPAAGVDGALRIMAISRDLLHGLAIAALAVFGLAMFLRPLTQRIFALGGLYCGLVVLGIFLPTFTRQLLDGAFISCSVLVGIAWCSVSLLQAARRLQTQRLERRAAELRALEAANAAIARSEASAASVAKSESSSPFRIDEPAAGDRDSQGDSPKQEGGDHV